MSIIIETNLLVLVININYLLNLLPDGLLFKHLIAVEKLILRLYAALAGHVIDVGESASQVPSLFLHCGGWDVHKVFLGIELVLVLSILMGVSSVVKKELLLGACHRKSSI